jgi:hypothetical protein
MDIAAERNFGLVNGARSAHIRKDMKARSDKETGQKSLSPKGFAENGPATLLFLSRITVKDMGFPSPANQFPQIGLCAGAHSRLLRHASSAARSGRNSNIQSFLTGG